MIKEIEKKMEELSKLKMASPLKNIFPFINFK